MIQYSKGDSVFSEAQMAAIKRINSEVGRVRLYKLERIIKEVAKAQGTNELGLPEDGYRSVYSPQMLDAPLKKFLAPCQFHPDKRRLDRAVRRVKKMFKGLGLCKPLSLDEAYLKLIDTKVENFAGLPTCGKKGEDTEALARAKQCFNGKCPPPVLLGHRGKNLDVARVTWMFPFEWHINEAAFFYPLQEKMKRQVKIYASSNAVSRRAIFNEIAASGKYSSKLAMDYSGFDGSIGTQLIGIAFQILSEHLVLEKRWRNLWNRVATYFSTCPFVDQYGQLVKGRRGGVPSGSMFTQMIDTIVNAIIIEYVFDDCVEKRYFVYGDDSLTFLKLSCVDLQNRLEDIKRLVKQLGIEVNLKKTKVVPPQQAVEFLGHYDLKKGRPAIEVLTRLIFPERPFKVDVDSLSQRVCSYMAESDEVLRILTPVFYILQAEKQNPKAEIDVRSFALNGAAMFRAVGKGESRPNPRTLPGLAQYLANEDPELCTGYFRTRAAV